MWSAGSGLFLTRYILMDFPGLKALFITPRTSLHILWLLREPAFLFAFLSRQRSTWLFMEKKDLFLLFLCVKGGRVLLLYHRAVGAIKRHSVLVCHQLDILLSVWENEFTCSFPFFIKKKSTNGPAPSTENPSSIFQSSLWPVCPGTMCRLCAISVAENKKIALNISPPRQPHRWFLWHASAQFRRLGRRSFVYEMKTTRIKGHGGLKMSDINSPNKTRVGCCLPVLSHSFLWETTPPSSTGDGFFVFWLTTGVAHEEPCCYGYWFIYMLTYKFTSKAYPN